MIHFIRMNLDLEGFAVHEAYDGKDALDQIRKVLPDLVILDVMMPKMKLITFCHNLRSPGHF